jgi:hypothetical protein
MDCLHRGAKEEKRKRGIEPGSRIDVFGEFGIPRAPTFRLSRWANSVGEIEEITLLVMAVHAFAKSLNAIEI